MTADRTEPANLDSGRGGLVIRDVAASLDQDFTMYNDNEPAIYADSLPSAMHGPSLSRTTLAVP